MTRPISPLPYSPASYLNLKEDLADALERHIKAKNLTASEISKRYASVRDHHIRQIRTGNGTELGLKMLFSIAEASGLPHKIGDRSMSKEKEISRRFSKKITLNSLIAFFGIAFVGIIFENPDTAGILEALGPWVVAMLAIYMSVGYLDFRTAQGFPSFFDTLLSLVFSRKTPRKKFSRDDGDAE